MGIRAFETESHQDGVKVKLCYVDIGKVESWGDAVLEWLLTPDEKVEIGRFKFPKRRNDWLGGRLAAKFVVARALGASPAEVDVVPNWTRKPFARVSGQYIPADISISHSGDVAVAALVQGARVGVDIERVEPRSQGFFDEAFSEAEHQDMLKFGAWDALTKAWTMKEALSKAMGIGLGLTLHDIEVRDLRQGHLALSQKGAQRLIRDPGEVYKAYHPDAPEWATGYIISVCCVQEDLSAWAAISDFTSREAGHSAIRTGGITDGIR